MSKTYCMCVGNRGVATRRGGRDGVKVVAQSYDGSIVVRNWYEGETLKVSVGTNDYSATYVNGPEFLGTFADFNKLLELHEAIKSGEVSVVHHRKKAGK